ncbi:MAG: tetratricopeptide repeat protein [Undibacterium sp.]|uniref:O-linked N-acetylglucosamine transferase, SPINDLY family protein n=1 Tax=Undibacterium sp. TaxID=1914977 RepID=UPI00271AB78F|nr:tetratricopeptide repeat protein [Undibacterium sp.]MDO8651594.1 tetratricopeptide repeat protein [Undibacterium sp.]
MTKENFNLQKNLREAKTSYQAEQLGRAKDICLAIIQRFPRHLEANNLLAKLCHALGNDEEGLFYVRGAYEASSLSSENLTIYFDILNKVLQKKQYVLLESASIWLTKVIPRDGNAWNYLGVAYIEQGKFLDAHNALMKAANLLPKNPQILNNLGNSLISLDRYAEAIIVLRRALIITPSLVVALNNLGNAFKFIGNTAGAIDSISEAITLAPDLAYLRSNLGLAYLAQGTCELAIQNFNKALDLEPDLFQVYPNLIDALRQSGRVQDAIVCSELALKLYDNFPEIWASYGYALQQANHLDAAIQAFIKAMSFKDDLQSSFNRRIFTSLLFCVNYQPDLTAEAIYSAYQEFDQRFCLPYKASWQVFTNAPTPTKRLKIGYVTSSFYDQVCKYFLIPLLEKHDKSVVEVFAYANPPFEDATTAQYKSIVEHWVPTNMLTDDELAERIRADGIDILVDVAGHTNDNRLPVFARKPAPVSLHWLEYGYTTGLSAIDYYLTDKASVTDNCAHLFSEKIHCLDGPAYTYRPDTPIPELSLLPADKTGIITFGSLSRSVRINHKVVKLWAAILDAMPNSRLIINSGDFKDPKVQDEMASRFTRYGIERSRLDIGFNTPSWEVLKHIDIGLDCFPHNSGTTLLETLYMGVPFITLLGRPTVGRIGASVLTGLGREEWISYSEEEYAQKALMLAHDIDGLRKLRKNLRQEMETSPVMNEPAFARSVEKAYREMWKTYCEEQKP